MFVVAHACDKDLFYLGNCDLNSPSKSSISNNISSSSLTHNSRCFRSTSPCNSRQPFWPCRLTRTLIILSYGEWEGLNRAASRLWSPRVDFWGVPYLLCGPDFDFGSSFCRTQLPGGSYHEEPPCYSLPINSQFDPGLEVTVCLQIKHMDHINPKSTFEVHRNTNLKLLLRVYSIIILLLILQSTFGDMVSQFPTPKTV